MSAGLIALFDDVAAIAKVAAASLDDVVSQAARTGAKSAGVLIDDAAVTPRYVVGFAAEREVPIVVRIAKGSLKNKLLYLLPAAVLLNYFAPWAVTPLLMVGGLYLCYEGAEKVWHVLVPHSAHKHEAKLGPDSRDPKALEDAKVAGAIRTDFILSAEIMAISLNTLTQESEGEIGLWKMIAVLAVVAVGITVAVYGSVALIVKADDAGVALAKNERQGPLGTLVRGLGRGLVKGMPYLLKTLTIVGTAAMIWVGGGILLHGLEAFHVEAPAHFVHHLAEKAGHASPVMHGLVEWFVGATCAGVVGLVVGALMIPIVGKVIGPLWKRARGGGKKAPVAEGGDH